MRITTNIVDVLKNDNPKLQLMADDCCIDSNRIDLMSSLEELNNQSIPNLFKAMSDYKLNYTQCAYKNGKFQNRQSQREAKYPWIICIAVAARFLTAVWHSFRQIDCYHVVKIKHRNSFKP